MYETIDEQEAFFRPLFQFQRLRELGRGGFGLALLVFDSTEQRQKVFKLPKDANTTEALRAEGSAFVKLQEVQHKNIIQLHQFGMVEMEWNGQREQRYYLHLAYGGQSLEGVLGRHRLVREMRDDQEILLCRGGGRRLPVEQALRIAMDVCQGLEGCHGVRMLHRDVKPSNILIDEKSGVARLTDLGLARVVERSTGLMSLAGTPMYMDAQCFEGKPDARSDLYALAMTIYEMLTGDLPFSSPPGRLSVAPPDPRQLVPEVSEELAGVILRAMEPDRSRRYASASQMLASLRRIDAALNPLPPRYVRVDALAKGCFACDDTETHERVVVRLFETSATLDELAREAVRLEEARLDGAALPKRHFRNEQMTGIVTAPPRGKSLALLLEAEPCRNVESVRTVCDCVARAAAIVARVHAVGGAHGLLAPALIWREGAERVTVDGFGLAPVLARAPRTGDAGGLHSGPFSPFLPFMAPNLLVEPRAPLAADDVFALGAILFFALTGQPLIGADTQQQLVRQGVSALPTLNPRAANPLVTRRLAGAVLKAACWNAHDRTRDAAELAAQLRACRWPEDVVETLVDDALETYEQGNALRAYELLDQALDADPGNPQPHAARGRIYYREKEFKWAIAELEAAVGVAPDAPTLVLLARCFMEGRQEHERAAALLAQALALGETAEIHALLARCDWSRGRQDAALQKLDRAIALEPDESIRRKYEYLLTLWKNGNANVPPEPNQAP